MAGTKRGSGVPAPTVLLGFSQVLQAQAPPPSPESPSPGSLPEAPCHLPPSRGTTVQSAVSVSVSLRRPTVTTFGSSCAAATASGGAFITMRWIGHAFQG